MRTLNSQGCNLIEKNRISNRLSLLIEIQNINIKIIVSCILRDLDSLIEKLQQTCLENEQNNIISASTVSLPEI